MAVESTAEIEISAFNWVPPFARGLVRDLRVRWVLEELGLSYRERLLDGRAARPEDYYLEQPWGQVPVLSDKSARLFESGAIVLYLAERSEDLLPRDPAARARVTAWVIAAVNSMEPAITEFFNVDVISKDAEWAKLRHQEAEDKVRTRLSRLSDWLGDKDYLEGRFAVGDVMMTSVLRFLGHTGLVAAYPNLAAYQARCQARPAFQRALDAQMSAFERADTQADAA